MFTHCLEQPTRTASLTLLSRRFRFSANSPRCRPYSVLLPVWFAMPPPLPKARCALTAPFHPYPASPLRASRGGSFSVALSLGLSPLALRQNPAGCYPAPYVDGARTFLPRSLSGLAGGAGRPTDAVGMGAERGQVKVLFTSLRGALATKQSSPSACAALDCFASLAMTVVGPALLPGNLVVDALDVKVHAENLAVVEMASALALDFLSVLTDHRTLERMQLAVLDGGLRLLR